MQLLLFFIVAVLGIVVASLYKESIRSSGGGSA
jgi:hypothetical protein